MSTLEERREARRRRRQMEEEMIKSGSITAEDLDARLAQRRQERESRMAAIAAGVSAVNGEDDMEKRRRERREARIRQDDKRGESSAPAEEETRSSRRNRRQQEDDTSEDTTSIRSRRRRGVEEEVSSYRSRRRRGGDEEETPTVNDTSAEDSQKEAEEAARRRQEQEEEEARRQQEQAEEEERQRQAALAEQRRREAEEDRRREEERVRKEHTQDEEEFVELERQLSEEAAKMDEVLQLVRQSKDKARQEEQRSRIERVKQWAEGDGESKGTNRRSLELDKDAENSNKVREKRNKFETLREEEKRKGEVKVSTVNIILPERKDKLKDKLQKFELEIENAGKTTTKDPKKQADSFQVVKKISQKLQHFETQVQPQKENKPLERSNSQIKSDRRIQGAGEEKLKDIQRKFESSGGTGPGLDRQSALGRWSASESHIHSSEPGPGETRRSVLNRWKHSVDPDQSSTVELRSPPPKSPSEKAGILTNRLSGNTEFIASRFMDKVKRVSGDPDSAPVPQARMNGDKRHSSQSSLSDISDRPVHQNSVSKVKDRWQFDSQDSASSQAKSWKTSSAIHSRGSSFDNSGIHSRGSSFDNSGIHSRGSSYDNSGVHSRGSSYDASSDTASTDLRSPPTERRSDTHQQEEEERLEQERLEREEQEAEEAARMAAEEEKSKKKGKRKGLGGLSPEKKKLLKVEYDSEEEDEKWEVLSERIQPLPDDLDTMSADDLKKLCKQLNSKIAQMEEELYDWEFKIRKQDIEINELTLKVNDSKGKFAKPVLRKVNKREKAVSAHHKNKPAFRDTLKSSGQNKYGLDEETPEVKAAPDWRDTLKKVPDEEAT